MKECAVRASNVSKVFPSGSSIVNAVTDISVCLELGKMVFIVGPSGCGKTTLISMLSGILSPSSGTVHVKDVEITALNDNEKTLFRQQFIGFVFQDCQLIPTLTIAENIGIPLIAANISIKEAVKKANEILEALDMSIHSEKFPNQLSGGEKQRVAIARALINNPYLLICDEPTANLDSHTGYKILAFIKKFMAKQDRCAIVVTHDTRILSFADQVIYMSDGRIKEPNVQP